MQSKTNAALFSRQLQGVFSRKPAFVSAKYQMLANVTKGFRHVLWRSAPIGTSPIDVYKLVKQAVNATENIEDGAPFAFE